MQQQCIVCDNCVTHCFQGCGHACVCTECASYINGHAMQCPMCRNRSQAIKLYFPDATQIVDLSQQIAQLRKEMKQAMADVAKAHVHLRAIKSKIQDEHQNRHIKDMKQAIKKNQQWIERDPPATIRALLQGNDTYYYQMCNQADLRDTVLLITKRGDNQWFFQHGLYCPTKTKLLIDGELLYRHPDRYAPDVHFWRQVPVPLAPSPGPTPRH